MIIKDHQKEPLLRDLKLGGAYLVVLSLIFGAYLIRTPMSVGITILSFFAFIFFVGIYVLQANPTLIKILGAEAERVPARLWQIPLGLWLVSLVYALLAARIDLYYMIAGLLYCMLPVVFIILLRGKDTSLQWLDVALILFMWLPIEFGWIPGLSIPPQHGMAGVYHLIGLALIIYFYFAVRRLPDVGFTFRLKGPDWRTAIQNFIFFMPIALIFGFATGFIDFSQRVPSLGQMFATFVGIAFFTAIPEEILFRGVIHNLIKKKLTHKKNGTIIALTISSVIFGLAHGDNHNAPFIDIHLGPLGTWHAPWVYMILATVAGYFYGWTFIKTRKVTAAAIVHLLVDWTWGTFFGG